MSKNLNRGSATEFRDWYVEGQRVRCVDGELNLDQPTFDGLGLNHQTEEHSSLVTGQEYTILKVARHPIFRYWGFIVEGVFLNGEPCYINPEMFEVVR